MSFELLKVEFRVTALDRTDDGIVGESVLIDGVAYSAGIDGLPAAIRKAVEDANAALDSPDAPDEETPRT